MCCVILTITNIPKGRRFYRYSKVLFFSKFLLALDLQKLTLFYVVNSVICLSGRVLGANRCSQGTMLDCSNACKISLWGGSFKYVSLG